MNHTTNYNLPQWEDSDRVTRSDVNDAMSAIDAALMAVGGEHVYVGSYTGDGQATRTITFPWPPKFMILFGWDNSSGTPNAGRIYFLTQGDSRLAMSYGVDTAGDVTLSGSTLSLRLAGNYTNVSGKKTTYILFR